MSPYNRRLGPGLGEIALGIWASIVIVAKEAPRMAMLLWREELAPRIATQLAPIVPHKPGSWIWRYDETRKEAEFFERLAARRQAEEEARRRAN